LQILQAFSFDGAQLNRSSRPLIRDPRVARHSIGIRCQVITGEVRVPSDRRFDHFSAQTGAESLPGNQTKTVIEAGANLICARHQWTPTSVPPSTLVHIGGAQMRCPNSRASLRTSASNLSAGGVIGLSRL